MQFIYKKRSIFLFFLLSIFVTMGSAQNTKIIEITDKQWKELLTSVQTESWDTAFDLSTKYLKQVNNSDAANHIANLRYICLYSAAGRVFEGKMSYDQLEKFVKDFEGKKLIFPFRTIAVKCGGRLNYICASDEGKNKALTIATNNAGTSILAFEYIEMKDYDFAKHEGAEIAIGGIAKSVVPNPNRSNLVILRIYVSEGFVVK